MRSPLPGVERLPWRAGGPDGEEIRTANHRVLSTVSDPVVSSRLGVFVEDSLLHYRTAFGTTLPRPSARMTSYVLGTRGEWARIVGEQLPPQRARRYLRIQRGGLAENGVGYYFDIGTQDTFAVAAHEGWHQYTQTTFRGRLPTWLEEGCATFCEGFRWSTSNRDRAAFAPWANVERFDRLRDARRVGSLLSLRELIAAQPAVLLGDSQDATLDYYAQLWALLHFLREGEGGRHAPSLMLALQHGASGQLRLSAPGLPSNAGRGTRVFASYFGSDWSRLEREYAAFIERVVASGSKQAIVAGMSPIAR